MINKDIQRYMYFIPFYSQLIYSNLQARELKSIHLDAEGHFVKLVLHKNHVNKYNIYNQVSCF